MTLQEMLDQARTGDAQIEEGWGQGRATYGGLVGGLLLAAIRGQVGEERGSLRSVTLSFVAPVAPGTAEIEPVILRAGSRATQAQATLRQGGQVGAVALASFGTDRESTIEVAPSVTMPQLPSGAELEAIEPFPHLPGLTPDFFAHVELRLLAGEYPYTGASTAQMSGTMRLREAPPTFDVTHFVTLADAWPPAVIQMLTTPAPASSMTWTLELLGDFGGDPTTQWVYDVRTDHAADGYAHTEAHVWHPDGRLVAISRQTIAVFG